MKSSEYDDLPKGMKRVPEEFKEQPDKKEAVTHYDCNYTAMIREALENLSVHGVCFNVRRLELLEEEGSSSIVSMVIEVEKR